MPRATFQDLIEVMHELRKKCPWDQEQTFVSLRQYVLEEAYEVADAIDQVEKDPSKLADELGDLLFQVVFQAELASERKWFDAGDVCGGIREKLVRRHPHVFASTVANSAGEVVKNWEAIKTEERKGGGATSALDGVPRALPSLLRAEKMGSRAARAGFDWPTVDAVLEKIEEELAEVRAALKAGGKAEAGREVGDLLFAAAQTCRLLGVNPEEACRAAGDEFEARFRHLESALATQGKTPKDLDDAALDKLWNEAKAARKAAGRS